MGLEQFGVSSRVRGIEDRSLGILQSEEHKEKNLKIITEPITQGIRSNFLTCK